MSSPSPQEKPPAKEKDDGRGRLGEPLPRTSRLGLLLLIPTALLLWLWFTGLQGFDRRTIPYSEFKAHLARGEVTRCLVRETEIEGEIAPVGGLDPGTTALSPEAGVAQEAFRFRTFRVEDPDLVQDLAAAGVEFEGSPRSVFPELLLVWLLPLGLLVLIWVLLMRRAGAPGASMMSFGKSRARLVADRDVGVDFDDVAGCEEAKSELREIVEFLRTPERFRRLGARIPHGVLLVGPPGTGKTLLGRAVAGEARVAFFSLSGSDFVEMFVGVGAARVRDLFEQAKRLAPCIIFIDELDAVGRQRGVRIGNVNDEREHTLNQLLVEMDGFGENPGVVVMAATNRPDVLDPALLRPGRFDRQVVLDAPDRAGREAILRVHVRGKRLDPEVDLAKVASVTPGFSGADLANAVNEAALLAARHKADRITQSDLEEAVEKVVAGPERKSRRLGEEERRRVAYHESGHALVAVHTKHADPVRKISIVPRGRAALGYTLQLPTGDRYLMSRSELMGRLRGTLGGRAAEELVLGEVSTGAENDLQQATALARQAVCQYGMGDSVGLMHVVRPAGEFLPLEGAFAPQRDCSEAMAHAIDDEVKSILEEAYGEAKALLSSRRDQLTRVAETLLDRETLDEADLKRLLNESGRKTT